MLVCAQVRGKTHRAGDAGTVQSDGGSAAVVERGGVAADAVIAARRVDKARVAAPGIDHRKRPRAGPVKRPVIPQRGVQRGAVPGQYIDAHVLTADQTVDQRQRGLRRSPGRGDGRGQIDAARRAIGVVVAVVGDGDVGRAQVGVARIDARGVGRRTDQLVADDERVGHADAAVERIDAAAFAPGLVAAQRGGRQGGGGDADD